MFMNIYKSVEMCFLFTWTNEVESVFFWLIRATMKPNLHDGKEQVSKDHSDADFNTSNDEGEITEFDSLQIHFPSWNLWKLLTFFSLPSDTESFYQTPPGSQLRR